MLQRLALMKGSGFFSWFNPAKFMERLLAQMSVKHMDVGKMHLLLLALLRQGAVVPHLKLPSSQLLDPSAVENDTARR